MMRLQAESKMILYPRSIISLFEIETFLLYTYGWINCSAQNKNWLLFSLFIHLINSDVISTQRIVLYYFEPGHTFMSCDQVHHQVEVAMKKKNKLYDFTDFEEAVASINNFKVIVKSMAIDFISVLNYVSDRRVQNSNPPAYLKDVYLLTFISFYCNISRFTY